MKKQRAMAPAMILVMGALAATMMAAAVGAQPGPPCSGTNHCVDITVTGGAIAPVPNTVISGRNHQIYWRIRTSGYSFPSPPPPQVGIAFKPPSSINDNGRMPANEFPCNRVSPALFHCTDAKTTHDTGVRSYQYSITVIDAAGHRIVSDPWIVNR
jgi:hypothetical protein